MHRPELAVTYPFLYTHIATDIIMGYVQLIIVIGGAVGYIKTESDVRCEVAHNKIQRKHPAFLNVAVAWIWSIPSLLRKLCQHFMYVPLVKWTI